MGSSGAECRQHCSDTGGVSSCDGDVLRRCHPLGPGTLDCALLGLHCVSAAASCTGVACEARCSLGDECKVEDSASCGGGVLRFCDNGKITEVSCTDLGFSGCTTASGGHCTL